MPFRKGDPSINRNGRPKKGQTLTDVISNILSENAVNYKGGLISGREAVARKLLELAMSGDVPAMKYLIDRMDGPPKQEIQHSGGISVNLAPLDETL